MATRDLTGIGCPLPRAEDRRLLTGAGQYSDDMKADGTLYAVMVRSPHAHAKLRGVERARAETLPGVVAVLTGADWQDDRFNPMPAWGNPKDVELKNHDGREIFYTPLWPVAKDRVRRAGEIVAVVVAETKEQAEEAAEAVSIECDPLPAVRDVEGAMAEDAPLLWEEIPGNINVDDEKGERDLCDELFAQAAHVVRLESHNQRVTGVPMEPRAVLAAYHADDDRFVVEAGGQGVIRFQNELAATFGVETAQVRVISRDVGGGYGTRNHTYPEFALAMWAAKRTGKPVKWICERTEAFLSDYAGRDLMTRSAIALNKEGRVTAMRSDNVANIGTHTVSYVPLARGPTVYNGVYDIPVAWITSKGVVTNTTATASYRGAGRPESMFVIERLMDLAALETGIDRVELRRRNLIGTRDIPYTNAVGVTYDSGDFGRSMDMALEISEWSRFADRRAESEAEGKLRGIGLANYIETATGYPQERAEMSILPGGIVELVMGTQSSGQGHETSYAQLVSDWLGVPFETIRLKTGDTDFVSAGSGSHSSRSMRLAGHLYRQTIDAILDHGRRIAAHLLECAPDDILYEDGVFKIEGTDRGFHLFDVAAAAETDDRLPDELRHPLQAAADIAKPLPSYPNGCHVAEVEIDPDTGRLEIVRYCSVDDVGRVINPLIVDGQTQGGIVQGVGQALMEECVYDEDGQLLAGSFMDYAMPRADDVPSFSTAFNEVIAPSTFLGVKGGGEGGTTAAPPALVNAIVDALSPFGVTHIEMPVTPEKIWRAMQTNAGDS